MKTTLFMAISANGMIADKSGGEEFLSHENWKMFSRLVEKFGNFVVGRKTYEAVKNWGEEYGFDDFVNAKKIILSQDKPDLPDGYSSAGSPSEALGLLEEEGFGKALIIGGATVNTSFAKENLLDEIILNIEPVVVGKGLSLFSEEDFMLRMKLVDTQKVTENIIQLQYEVRNEF